MEIQPLSHFYGTSTYEGLMRNRGHGIRNFMPDCTDEETLRKDYVETFTEKFLMRRLVKEKATHALERTRVWEWDQKKPLQEAVAAEPKKDDDGLCVACRRSRKQQNELDDLMSVVCDSDEGEDEVDFAKKTVRVECVSISALEQIMDDWKDEVDKDEKPEPPKKQEKTFKDQSVQTDPPKEMPAKTANVAPQVAEIKSVATNTNSSAIKQQWQAARTPLIPVIPVPVQQPPSLMGVAPLSQVEIPQDITSYEKAKAWKPATEEHARILEQVKKDIYQMLLISKGCKYRSIPYEYKKIVQEDLPFERIGMPNLRTLIVQLEDMVYLRADRNGTAYVYANFEHAMFKAFAHIAELVGEQRNTTNFVPDPGSLHEYSTKDLFNWAQQSNYSNYQSSYYGSYYPNGNWRATPNSPYSYWDNSTRSYQQYPVQQTSSSYYPNSQNCNYNYVLNAFTGAAVQQQSTYQRTFR